MTRQTGLSDATHLIAQMGLRAPRVVLLVPGWGDWHFMARNGIHAITQMWGGAGWLVVPVASADAHPAVLAALREYDPDHVAIPAANSFVARQDMGLLHDAQQAISAACANYRSPIATSIASPTVGELWSPYFSTTGPGALTELAVVADTSVGQTIGASSAVGGPLGLCAAAMFGLSEAPSRQSVNIDAQLRNRAVHHLLSYSDTFNFTSLVGVTTRDQAQGDFTTDFHRTTYGLSGVAESGPEDRPPALVVCGDTPADFALAMAWDRTYGYGIWLPDEWWDDAAVRPQVIVGIGSMAQRAYWPLPRECAFTSTSLSREQLVERVEGCTIGSERRLGEPLIRPPDEAIIHPAETIGFPRYHKTWYAIGRSNASQWSTAVREKAGTVEFAMLPPLPDIRVPELSVIEARAHWHVDIAVVDHQIPCTTALPERDLLAGRQASFGIRMRSSRRGISFEAQNSGLIMAGASLEEQLTRPFIRYPSLLDWAQARAEAHGRSTKLSAAGYRAEVLAKLLESRAELTELIAGQLLPALQAFTAKGPRSKDFPNDEGCLLNGEAYLHFAGMCDKAGIPSDMAIRDQIDGLVCAGVLQRGLIVNCAECAHIAFVPLENVATTIRCQRCRADNYLTRERWRQPDDEPRWFYDLHPTARALLESDANGHVPLLLSRHLRAQSQWGFADAPEFELLEDGEPVVEIDLLALADRRLISGEAKAIGALGKNKQGRNDAARKRVLAAKLLMADQIVIATTKDSWEPASVDSMKSAIRAQTWDAGAAPRLRIITGLGTASITDQFED
jgi:hypothetical protein